MWDWKLKFGVSIGMCCMCKGFGVESVLFLIW